MQEHNESTGINHTVRGRGVATAEPDLSILSFDVVGRAPSYSASI